MSPDLIRAAQEAVLHPPAVPVPEAPARVAPVGEPGSGLPELEQQVT